MRGRVSSVQVSKWRLVQVSGRESWRASMLLPRQVLVGLRQSDGLSCHAVGCHVSCCWLSYLGCHTFLLSSSILLTSLSLVPQEISAARSKAHLLLPEDIMVSRWPSTSCLSSGATTGAATTVRAPVVWSGRHGGWPCVRQGARACCLEAPRQTVV